MKQTRVAIGITTYQDISGKDHARFVYDALCQTDHRLCPEFVNWHEPINIAIENQEIWTEYWAQNATIEFEGIVSNTKFGGLWRRRKSVQNWGMVNHILPKNGEPRTSTLMMDFRWHAKIDWWQLFSELCNGFETTYGMLHLFTPEEIKPLDYQAFDGPVCGEHSFAAKPNKYGQYPRTSDGSKIFSFLPELSWANYLGPKFAHLYDEEIICANAYNAKLDGQSLMFRVSQNLGDVMHEHEMFSNKRMILRKAFTKGTFRKLRPAAPKKVNLWPH